MAGARGALVGAAAAALVAAGSAAFASEPSQPATPQQVVSYHDSGEWDADIARQAAKARAYLSEQLKHPSAHGKPAIVLDIDDTALSSYACMKRSNFERSSLAGCVLAKDQPAIAPTRSLYRFANKRKVAVFFVTGRPEALRDLTLSELRGKGFTMRQTLYMSKHPTAASAAPEKTATRKRITRRGYRIIVNVGDQRSDLTGGFAQRRYKLPNPMYFTP